METAESAKDEYAAEVCSRRSEAVIVPFVEVTLDGWTPEVAKCHRNVDRWVAAHSGCEVVRGWISYVSYGPRGEQLCSHSVVRSQDGSLFDITPVEPGQPRGGAFVPHQGDQEIFEAFKAHYIRCSSLDPEGDVQALCNMAAAYEIDPLIGDKESWT